MRPATAILVVLTLALYGAGLARAADFQKGLDAFGLRDFDTALAEWNELAEQGHGEARFRLAEMYRNGDGVEQDDRTALRWYRLAAETGLVIAQNYMGWIYENGIVGVRQDYTEAVKWWRLAAAQGSASAQNNLGMMHHFGRGVGEDQVRAYMWWTLAAAGGHAISPQHLEYLAPQSKQAEIAEAVALADACAAQDFRDC